MELSPQRLEYALRYLALADAEQFRAAVEFGTSFDLVAHVQALVEKADQR